MIRYKVTAWHGEARSLFYVVDTLAPEPEQPCVVRTYFTPYHAEQYARALNLHPPLQIL